MSEKRAPGSKRKDVVLATQFNLPKSGSSNVKVKVGNIDVLLRPPKDGWQAVVPQGEHRTAEYWVDVMLPDETDSTMFYISRQKVNDDPGQACVLAYNNWIQWHNGDRPVKDGDMVFVKPRQKQPPNKWPDWD